MRAETRLRIASLLREHGLRVTPQRRAIWAAFDDGRAGHLTADEVLGRARRDLPELSRATVYNALGEFVSAGLLTTFHGPGSQLYESNIESHHHFRCRACGALYDVQPTGLEQVVLDGPFAVERKRILFEGTCSSCAAAA